MNDLSWFLYLADVLPGAAGSLGSIGFGVSFLGGVGLLIWKFAYEVDKDAIEDAVDVPKGFWWAWSFFFFLFVITHFVPSKETIYLIAGSEAGEAVVTSETGQEILNDIQQVIKHQLKELKGE